MLLLGANIPLDLASSLVACRSSSVNRLSVHGAIGGAQPREPNTAGALLSPMQGSCADPRYLRMVTPSAPGSGATRCRATCEQGVPQDVARQGIGGVVRCRRTDLKQRAPPCRAFEAICAFAAPRTRRMALEGGWSDGPLMVRILRRSGFC